MSLEMVRKIKRRTGEKGETSCRESTKRQLQPRDWAQ